jgi:acetyl esterase/lipase
VPNDRRSPEHKFPAQIEDVERAYRWLLAQGIRPKNIASIGHSIGGNFAVSLVVRLRDKGTPLPAAILSVSPWYDIEMKNETLESNAETDALLSRPLVELFREAWIGGTGVGRNDPRVNLLYADLTGLPPIMVYYGAHEVLVGEAIEFAKRAKDAGVDVTLRSEVGRQLHGAADINLLDSSVFVEGPLPGGYRASLSLRRSYVDQLLPYFIPKRIGSTFVTAVPIYYDYQARVERDLRGGGRVSLEALGSDDALSVIAQLT